MLAWPVLEVVLTLLLIYAGLALLCSTAAEVVASWLRWRGRVLESALRTLFLGARDYTGQYLYELFFEAPLIRTLAPPWEFTLGHKTKAPSYVPPRAFTDTVLELIKPPDWGGGEPMTFNDFTRIVEGLPESDLKAALQGIGRGAGHDLAEVRRRMDAWFESVMDRATGWYKRRMGVLLLALSAVVCIGLDVDTLEVVRTGWKAARGGAEVAARPVATGGEPAPDHPSPPAFAPMPVATEAPDPAPRPPVAVPTPSTEKGKAPPSPPPAAREPEGRGYSELSRIVSRILGLLLSTMAVATSASLGFQLVTRFVNVRISGPRPK